MKAALWFFASVAIEISEKHPDELWLMILIEVLIISNPAVAWKFHVLLFYSSIRRTIPPSAASRIQCFAWLQSATTTSYCCSMSWTIRNSWYQKLTVKKLSGTKFVYGTPIAHRSYRSQSVGPCKNKWLRYLLKTFLFSLVSLKDLAKYMEIHLVAWQHIAKCCEELGLRLYKCRPKHHYCDHLGRNVQHFWTHAEWTNAMLMQAF